MGGRPYATEGKAAKMEPKGGIRGSEKGHVPPLAWVAQAACRVQKAGMTSCSKGTTKGLGKSVTFASYRFHSSATQHLPVGRGRTFGGLWWSFS